MQIIDATPDHLEAITAIHNHAVEHSTAIWDEDPVDIADRARWMSDRQAAGFPVLVAVDEAGEVLGFGSYGTWRTRSGYRRTVEHSVYVREDQRGKGLGRALLTALIEHARAAGIHVMVAGIEAGNVGSIRLHERLGFVLEGTMPQVGEKFGRWLDLSFLLLRLDDAAVPPARD